MSHEREDWWMEKITNVKDLPHGRFWGSVAMAIFAVISTSGIPEDLRSGDLTLDEAARLQTSVSFSMLERSSMYK